MPARSRFGLSLRWRGVYGHAADDHKREGIVTAKRIQTELRKEAFSPELDKKIYMTVSIGVAQYNPMEDMKTFVRRVDKLMYQAKKDGRDRICPDRIGHK